VPGREEGCRSGAESITDPTRLDTRETVDRLAAVTELRRIIRKAGYHLLVRSHRREFVVVLIVAVLAAPALSGDVATDMKKAGKSISKAAEKFGHEIAKSSRKIGESVADATEEGAKTAWFTTRDWATRESKRVADATVRFWDDVIRGKETTRDRLRRENETLKRNAAEHNR
jgi:hypothetical protein